MGRKTSLSASPLFDNINPHAASRAAREDVVQRIPLDTIRPDPRQPRRTLPPDLAGEFHRGELAPSSVLDELVRRGHDDEQVAKILERWDSLAADIDKVGLVNPITVYETEEGKGLTQYTMETGEQRWWAHWWLVRQGKDAYRHIRSLVVPSRHTRVRQLSENLKRQQLTAVETALGLALLILEIESQPALTSPGVGFVPADIRGMATRRLKSGVWPEVVERMGYTKRRWQQYLLLLRLCDEALELAHRHRLGEGALRDVVQLDRPAEQVAAVKTIVARSLEEQGKDQVSEGKRRTPRQASGPTRLRRLRRWQKELIWSGEQELELLRKDLGREEGRQALIALRDQVNRLLEAFEPDPE